MASFSERQGYKPDRSRLHQYEEMDDRLRTAIWNFLLERYFDRQHGYLVYDLVKSVWVEVVGRLSDELPWWGVAIYSFPNAVRMLRSWYFEASWNEVYDTLEYLLRKHKGKTYVYDANAMLSREGSAYRFIADLIVPITTEQEIAEIEAVAKVTGPFQNASLHIRQAVSLLSNRDTPDFRNAIKESISAVETAVQVAVGDIEKGLQG